MTYKEFVRWCNDRACDGCWGMLTSMVCIDIIEQMKSTPFWKRKKKWKEYEQKVEAELVNPTNEKIHEVYGEGYLHGQ